MHFIYILKTFAHGILVRFIMQRIASYCDSLFQFVLCFMCYELSQTALQKFRNIEFKEQNRIRMNVIIYSQYID